MANQKHLDILNKGVEMWNQWRREHARFHPDLVGFSLSEANLTGADLSSANLNRASLSEANLTGALQPHFLITAIEGKLFSLSSTCFEHIVEVSHILIGKIHTGPNHEFPPHGMSKSCVASAKNGGLSLGENLHFLLLRQWKP